MEGQREGPRNNRGKWSTKKKDSAPAGVYRHPSGDWAIRYTCGAGHPHKERVGPLKTDAKDARGARHARAKAEPGWCPREEGEKARVRAKAESERKARRQTFKVYAESSYLPWAKLRHRGYRTTRSQVTRLVAVFGNRMLDEITTSDIERHLARIEESGLARGTVNRYRDRLSAMYRRALRLGLVEHNPVKGIEKHKEPGGRVVYLPQATSERPAYEEEAVRDALAADERDLFTVSVHTGLRWSEQVGLRWRDADMLSATITIPQSKHGEARQVPMNARVRCAHGSWRASAET